MSVIFPLAILGPEIAVPILWAPVFFWFFLLENPHAHKIPRFRGGGGGSANLIFMGAGIFLTSKLRGPISRDDAILAPRYPVSRDTFSPSPALPRQGAQYRLCGALFCSKKN